MRKNIFSIFCITAYIFRDLRYFTMKKELSKELRVRVKTQVYCFSSKVKKLQVKALGKPLSTKKTII